MADEAFAIPVAVSVERCTNLKPSRQDVQMTSFVRVEFGSRTQCETPKTPVNEKTAHYEAQTSFTIGAASRNAALDEISHKPIVLTVFECVPKDKKAKEDKTNVIGQTSIDLLPFLRGSRLLKGCQPVYPTGTFEIGQDEAELPQIEFSIALQQPLLSDVEINEGNIFSVRIDSMYSIPDGWAPGSGYSFTVSLPVPVAKAMEATVVLPHGQLKSAGDREPPMRRWSYVGTATGMSQMIRDSEVHTVPYEEEDGDLKSARHIHFRHEAERNRSRVTWNSERRCLLDSNACTTFQSLISKSRIWPVEIFRVPIAVPGSKQKGVEESQPSHHGVAYVNLTPLLYPGATQLRGAYPIQPYIESEVSEKTRRSQGTSTLEVAMRSISVAGTRNIPSARGRRKSAALPKPSGLAVSSFVASEAGAESIPEVNLDSKAYVDAKSYVVLEIVLERPFVAKRPPEVLSQMVGDIVPPRPAFSKRVGGADVAVKDFRDEVSRVASHVLDEFRCMFGEKLAQNELPLSNEAAAHRRKQLVYHLNTSGKYHFFKEQLKYVIVKVVREKFSHKHPFQKDGADLRAFLGQLYVFLVDEMHTSLSKTFSVDDARAAPPSVSDAAAMKHFAREAEVNLNFELASRFYQERLASDGANPDYWVDYGRFSLLTGDVAKAAECFRQAISSNQRHITALLMFAIVTDRDNIAETFFESAAAVDSQNVVTWTVMGLYYEMTNNDVRSEMAFLEAHRANAGKARAAAAARRLQQEDADDENDIVIIPENDTIPVEITDAEPDRRSTVSRQQSSSTTGPAVVAAAAPTLAMAPRGLTVSNVSAVPSVSSALPPPPKSPLLAPSIAIPSPPPPAEPVEEGESIFLQTAYFLLEMQATDWAAKALEHEFIESSSSSSYYIALACVNMQKKLYDAARSNLTEALVYDYQNPDTWALLGHVEYLTGNREEAKAAYERVLDFIAEASDMHTVYLRLGSLYIQEEQFVGAKNTFLLACKRSPTSFSWLGVGIACYRMGDLREAEDALCEANILNNADPEVWGYLAMVCLHTGRKVEAEQAYKYALKVNLCDQKLLDEIHALQNEVGFGDPSK
eukprot:m.311063 g.311063  ORF g.311063 m.311063 type:complete len:1084 (+) comp59046_c0_seq1:3-3254(+)